MRDFKKYHVWKTSHQLALSSYKMTSSFPKEEIFGITSQIRRASTSIPSNIAEGCGRESDPDFRRFLYIAFSSASELEYLFILSKDLGHITNSDFEVHSNNVREVKKMLTSLIKKLSNPDS